MTKADELLSLAYLTLRLSDASDAEKYSKIPQIVNELGRSNDIKKIAAGTTGTISERLCGLALSEIWPDEEVRTFGRNWKWVGDKLLPGHPYDVAVSIKSFTAKERLLASGTGSLLTPTIGWGLFDDASEWSKERTASYLYRGFISIYMPLVTLEKLPVGSREVQNINGSSLLRELADFPIDLNKAKSVSYPKRLDVRKL